MSEGEGAGAPDPGASSAERAAFEGFSLALRVMYHLYAPEAPASEVEKPWEMAKEIAEGRLSLSNPADTAARFPEMKEFLYERMNRVVARERQVARAVLQGLQEAL